MKDVRFDSSGSEPVFRFKNADGVDDRIVYKPSTTDLWNDLNKNDFSVELLINPILSSARHVYNICLENSKSRVGMVFPVSALDDKDCFDQKGENNYAYVAYLVLLERLEGIDNSDDDLSDNFEDNVCVCVFNLKTLGLSNPLHLCINSLRKYGYSYFEPENKIKPVDGYTDVGYVDKNIKNLVVKFEEPKMYGNPVIDMMLRALPHANNIIHRFVLLYQVIETMMEEISLRKINEEIDKLQKEEIPHNDFLDNLKRIGQEKVRIKEIFDICMIDKAEFACFRDSCKKLYSLTKYNPGNESEQAMLFYSFRNQMTHTFRNLHCYPQEVADTVQGFEKVIITILEKYS
jgi:hypothetical protein